MSVYFVITYDIENEEEYKYYNPDSNHITAATVMKHLGEILSVGENSIQLHGNKQSMKVIIKFPNKQNALDWYDDPEYAEAKTIRLGSTKNTNAFIIDELTVPSA